LEAEDRRKFILNWLRQCSGRITGTELAKQCQVSRQIIVQDIAILRAVGEEIVSTPQGYMLLPEAKKYQVQKIISCHHNREQIKDEIEIIINQGGRVLNVIVEHPLYGQLQGSLMIDNRKDLEIFLSKIHDTGARPLSALTHGSHLHTIETPTQETMEKIINDLDRAGILEVP